MKPAAILGWTGNGSLEDLAATSLRKLQADGADITTAAKSLVVRGRDPVAVARRLEYLPGVSWIAVGYEFGTSQECLARLALLASRYLDSGSSFRVGVEAANGARREGDLLMEATSTILKSVKGARVDEKGPAAQFRITEAGSRGACGVQLREGAGGAPTSKETTAHCLVSGGYHSAVTAWMAALSGFSLTLVHARDDDESLRQVARLYAELSRRMDASSLELNVLEGEGSPGDRVAAWLRGAKGEVFAGVHFGCRGATRARSLRRFPKVLFPLLLLQEAEIRSRLVSLGIREKASDRVATLSFSRRGAAFRVKRFGGREADQNSVLDSILAQP